MVPTLLVAESTSKLKKESSWFSRWKSPYYNKIAKLYIKETMEGSNKCIY